MKISIESINDKKNHLEEDIPAKDWEMDSSDVIFVGSIHVDCSYFKVHEEVVVEAEITTQRDITCSRCLNLAHQTQVNNFSRSYSTKELGEYLDLSQDIREEILLNFPAKLLCTPDCKGICAGCGVDLNVDQCKCKESPKFKKINNIEY